jgi:hypothetical protein
MFVVSTLFSTYRLVWIECALGAVIQYKIRVAFATQTCTYLIHSSQRIYLAVLFTS